VDKGIGVHGGMGMDGGMAVDEGIGVVSLDGDAKWMGE